MSTLSLAAFRALPLPEQVRHLRAAGQWLATRQEGGVRQHLHALWGFFVETWHWADDDSVGLVNSFHDAAGLEVWVAHVRVPPV